jgi:hypothetical protein
MFRDNYYTKCLENACKIVLKTTKSQLALSEYTQSSVLQKIKTKDKNLIWATPVFRPSPS